jgi:hypothetical protein
LPSQAGDDADATASLIATLRNGYSHTADGTYLPAPLSFKSKILDYMDRYGTSTEPETDDLAEEYPADIGEDLEAESSSKEQPIAYGELRRWFEDRRNSGKTTFRISTPRRPTRSSASLRRSKRT